MPITLSCTVNTIFNVRYRRDVEIWVRVRSRSMMPIDIDHIRYYWSAAVTMAVFCTVFEIKRDIGRITPIFHIPLLFNLHDPLEPH